MFASCSVLLILSFWRVISSVNFFRAQGHRSLGSRISFGRIKLAGTRDYQGILKSLDVVFRKYGYHYIFRQCPNDVNVGLRSKFAEPDKELICNKP